MSDVELTEVREQHAFDEAALHSYLGEHVAGYSGTLSVQQFEGGQSNPTFKLSTPEREYVLRKQPPGELLPSAHQVDREYRVMHALRDTPVPVPKMFCLCEDPTVIGTKFYVMEMVAGRLFVDVSLPEQSPTQRRAIFLNLIESLGHLHNVDVQAVGLETFGKAGNYFERQMSRWSKQYEAAKTEQLDDMDELNNWLQKNIPSDDSSGIVHGDYRLGNVLVATDSEKIATVLDWELSTIGHPLADFGYFCQDHFGVSMGAHEGLGGKDLAKLGIPDIDELADRYCAVTGRNGIDNLPFYLIFNFFRSAGILQGVYKRGLDGNASSSKALLYKDAARTISRQGVEMLARHG